MKKSHQLQTRECFLFFHIYFYHQRACTGPSIICNTVKLNKHLNIAPGDADRSQEWSRLVEQLEFSHTAGENVHGAVTGKQSWWLLYKFNIELPCNQAILFLAVCPSLRMDISAFSCPSGGFPSFIDLHVAVEAEWKRKWQPTPVLLPGESQGWGAWWAAVYGVAQSRTRLKWLSSWGWKLTLVPSLILLYG